MNPSLWLDRAVGSLARGFLTHVFCNFEAGHVDTNEARHVSMGMLVHMPGSSCLSKPLVAPQTFAKLSCVRNSVTRFELFACWGTGTRRCILHIPEPPQAKGGLAISTAPHFVSSMHPRDSKPKLAAMSLQVGVQVGMTMPPLTLHRHTYYVSMYTYIYAHLLLYIYIHIYTYYRHLHLSGLYYCCPNGERQRDTYYCRGPCIVLSLGEYPLFRYIRGYLSLSLSLPIYISIYLSIYVIIHLHVYLPTHLYACMRACGCSYGKIPMCTYIHIYRYINGYTKVCMQICIYLYAHANAFTFMCIYKYIGIYIYIHVWVHIHTHAYVYNIHLPTLHL